MRSTFPHALVMVLLAMTVGCQEPDLGWLMTPPAGSLTPPARERTSTALQLRPVAEPLSVEPQRPPQRTVTFHIMLVRIPESQRNLAEKIWNYCREDALDEETRLRVDRNGLRVGVGHVSFWEPIQAAIETVPGVLSSQPDPRRAPPHFPFYLELDDVARDLTVFAVGADGYLSGGTWSDSRAALQVSHMLDPLHRERDIVTVIPLVRQLTAGDAQPAEMYRLWRSTDALWRVPRYRGRLFYEAAFTLPVTAGEFVVVAPSARADLGGLLGTTVLADDHDGLAYAYYVFIRPEFQVADG